MFNLILSCTDAMRIGPLLGRLASSGFTEFAITGSLALETHLVRSGQTPRVRILNDVDLVVESFAAIPNALADHFLCLHIHPSAPEGRMLLQLVDPERLRLDIFRAYGASLERSRARSRAIGTMQLITVEDLAARLVSILMALARGLAVPVKHADDFERLSDVLSRETVEEAWRDHRKPDDPQTFRDAVTLLRNLIKWRSDLLIVPDYCRDPDAVCPKCKPAGQFRLAPPATIISMLGYR